jgi:5-bromo-4-chloroindolyl phosphate hydrolysis protein
LQDVDEHERRRARNEALFREVNERIVDLETGYDRDDSLLLGFVCECPREDCSEMLEVTRGQYEAVRENPRRFLVLPGHEDGDIANVVERHTQYLVVEKSGEAGEVAIEQDPRS